MKLPGSGTALSGPARQRRPRSCPHGAGPDARHDPAGKPGVGSRSWGLVDVAAYAVVLAHIGSTIVGGSEVFCSELFAQVFRWGLIRVLAVLDAARASDRTSHSAITGAAAIARKARARSASRSGRASRVHPRLQLLASTGVHASTLECAGVQTGRIMRGARSGLDSGALERIRMHSGGT